jgi:hypothetical protein
LGDSFVSNRQIGYDGEGDIVGLGRTYAKILTFLATMRYAFILPVALLLVRALIVFGTVAKYASLQDVKMRGLFVWLELIY